MCLNPIFIKNPNYKRNTDKFYRQDRVKLVDYTSPTIAINCGHCSQCIALKQLYLVQQIQMESINNYLFMVMLSYNNDALSFLEIDDFIVPYADVSDIQNMFKRIRRENAFPRSFKYFCVSELGSKHGRPHFHLILSLPKYCVDTPYTPLNLEKELWHTVLHYWQHNIGSNRKPIYKDNLTFKQAWRHGKLLRNYDLHYIVPYATDKGVASAAFYCLKYMLKPSEREQRLQQALRLNHSPEQYKFLYKILKTRHFYSKGFGLVVSSVRKYRSSFQPEDFDQDIVHHIRKGIIFSREKSSFPFYIHPDDGTTFPLSPFYREHFLTYDDVLCFWNFDNDGNKFDSFFEHDFISKDQFRQAESDYNRLISIVQSSDIDYFL